MYKIILLCAGGMSTSMLVKKMEDAAAKTNFSCEVSAHGVMEAEQLCKDADMVLLGPQVGYLLKNIEKYCPCPIEIIKMQDYGLMNGENIINRVKEVLLK